LARIVISYSSSDRDLTAGVAAFLEGEGHDVWWDTDLISGDSYRSVIDDKLNDADVVVVVWTPESVRSKWVIAEADHAERLNKLLPVKTKGVKEWQIPKPFGTLHTQAVTDEAAILIAIEHIANPDDKNRKLREQEIAKAKDAAARRREVSAETEIRTYLTALLVFVVAGTILAGYWGGPLLGEPNVRPYDLLKASVLLVLGAILTIGVAAICFRLCRWTRNPVYSSMLTMTSASGVVFVWLGVGALSAYGIGFETNQATVSAEVTLSASLAFAVTHAVLLVSLLRGAAWVLPATQMLAVVQGLSLAAHETLQLGWWLLDAPNWFASTHTYGFLHQLYLATHVSGVVIAVAFLIVSAQYAAGPSRAR
jgi:hypothetical protein